MINIKEIEEEITKLENSNCTTYNICSKLAKLYIVRDHFKGNSEMRNNNMMQPSMNMPVR